jgi:hypothetical protein
LFHKPTNGDIAKGKANADMGDRGGNVGEG